MSAAGASIHASCVVLGETGVLIRGPSGAGKSTLALRLMLDPPRALPEARLVADDRVLLCAEGADLVAQAPEALAGLIEVRHLGIRQVPHLFCGKVKIVIDLAAELAPRLPDAADLTEILCGIKIQRLPVPPGADAALLLAAALATQETGNT